MTALWALSADELEGVAEEGVEVFAGGGVSFYGGFDGFDGGGALVAEVDEGGEDIFRSGAEFGGGRGGGGRGEVVELVFEFDDEALGEFFAYAGDAGEAGVVLRADGGYGALGAEAAEHFDGEFWADAGDGDEALEEALLVEVEEAEEGDGVFTDLGVDVEGDLRAFCRERGEGGDADGDVITDTGAFDDGLAWLLDDEDAAEVSDHGWG